MVSGAKINIPSVTLLLMPPKAHSWGFPPELIASCIPWVLVLVSLAAITNTTD